MVKTQNRKNKKNRKKNKKTKKVYGGEPTVITVKGLYNDDNEELLAYYILHNKMNDEQKEQYAEKHKVYIPSKSFFDDLGKMLDINTKRLKTMVNPYFYPGKSTVKFLKPPPFKSIAIHDVQDIKQIEMANQIIENINSQTFTKEPTTKYTGSNITAIIKEYKNFINDTDNETNILDGVTDIKEGKQMLRSPVILKTIGEKYGIFSNWSAMVKSEGGLDKIFEKMK